jgi:alpha-tubulin suppressor-like RCC1 family protein
VGADTDWETVPAGGSNTVALKTDGGLWAWGWNLYGQLGLGEGAGDSPVPVRVGTGTDWVSMSVGETHILAIKSDGSLWACGGGWYGTLGNGYVLDQSSYVLVGPDYRVP